MILTFLVYVILRYKCYKLLHFLLERCKTPYSRTLFFTKSIIIHLGLESVNFSARFERDTYILSSQHDYSLTHTILTQLQHSQLCPRMPQEEFHPNMRNFIMIFIIDEILKRSSVSFYLYYEHNYSI